MKKSILILCACAAFAGCSEDDLVVKKPAIPGSEVQFGATAYMSNGNGTRTAYGDADATNGKIELRWVKDDKIDIACPDAAAGRRKATYQIVETSIVQDENKSSIDNSQATELEKLGEYGIQWGEPGEHFFFALYPSSQSFTSDERGKIGMDADGVNGYLPVNQDPKSVTQNGADYILEPDMRYAFMVAKDTVDSRVDGATGVSLKFEPLVTALQFELTAPVIDAGNTTGAKDLTITSVSLYSSKGTNICGNFNYKFATGALNETNDETGYSRITMTLPDGVVLTGNSGNKADVTFFLLPTANIESGDLRLQVFYTYKGSPFVKSLKIGKQLMAKKKYYFRNVKLPDITSTVEGSSWFSALDPNVLISQLSIPVAGNAFSSYYKDTSTDPTKNEKYYKEQSLHYTELWNKGVRGFEFVTAHGKDNFDNSKSGTLENNRFVCNKTALNVTATDGTTVTFGNAFRKLADQLKVEGFKKECLIVICTYRTYGKSGNDCQQYVNDLEQWLTDNPDVSNKLVQLTPASTVGQLSGHIAIIVKPGEDAYSSKKTSEITRTTNYPLTIVRDWGTCCDKWNRRFGSGYAIEGAFAATGQKKIEDYLWGVANNSSNTEFIKGNYGLDFVSGYPEDNADNYVFNHSTGTDGEIVHVQEWARIVPESFSGKFKSNLSDSHTQMIYPFDTEKFYLWLNWPESFTQKENMIKKTVEASMATKGGSTENKIFINSLCGFYPTTDAPAGYYPYNTIYSYSSNVFSGRTISFKLDDAGAGGDYVTCAYDLNKWFYDWLTTKNKDDKGQLKQGPVGLVMLNHIGTTTGGTDDKSLDLVNWIMMNNFRFPLATDNSGDTFMPLKEEETDSDGEVTLNQ